MNILTLAEYKEMVGITSPNRDTILTHFVDFANSFTTNYLGYMDSWTYYADSEDYIILPNSLDISAVLLDGMPYTDFTQAGFKLKFTSAITGKLVIFFSAPTFQEGLKQGVFLLAKHYESGDYKERVQINGETVQTSSVVSIPSYIKTILDLYRES